ncbi:MAG: amidohydrolase family protein [Alphaproteobacteria bacterium]|nr:amidohydrolase family protein [Alphaproteobacteria bacterium]
MTNRPLTWLHDPHPTTTLLPKGATDCHCHVFGPIVQFPYAQGSGFKPADAPKEALFALHDQMGIERCVIVQSGCHGFDNSVVVDAMQARPGRYLGIALAPVNISDVALDTLAHQGFRGVRFNYMAHLAPGASDDELRTLAPRLADRGMHLQLHMEADLIEVLTPVLASLPVPVVIDHIGRIDASKGRDQKPFQVLLRLLDNPHVWCKVSGSERASRQDPPYADALPFAHSIVERFGDRVLWGTDWPHPNFRSDPPDDGDLFDLLPQIAPDASTLQALMVDNPTKLFRFRET